MGLTYRKAGVDDRAAEGLVGIVRRAARRTLTRNVLAGVGPFAALYRLPRAGYRQPILVSSCDGVGTKVLLADELGMYDGLGQDLVAMNVNDVATTGARPLFFLDYLAVGAVKPRRDAAILRSIARACACAECSLIGGETAQMPAVYGEKGFDLAGFVVGIVERRSMIGPATVKPKDILIGIASSGVHSNGFSLVRRVFAGMKTKLLEGRLPDTGRTLGEELLLPTLVYSGAVSRLAEKGLITGAAHITGGGIPGNLERILPQGALAKVEEGTWPVPAIFSVIQKSGKVERCEMYRVFNMGLGMILACRPSEADRVCAAVRRKRFDAFVVGEVVCGKRSVRIC